ncbi:MAG: DPP IV N-terminal domain-containing protein [Bacteroidaceae bacterium]|nr:DPP IV N-terminal domain-containing protein [Bacteroidaceae bacterium]
MAQDKTFTLEDLIPGGRSYAKFIPQTLRTTWWGNQLLKIDRDSISKWDGKTAWTPLFTQKQLEQSLQQAGLNKKESKSLTLAVATFPYSDEPKARFTTASLMAEYDWQSGVSHIVRFPAPQSWQDYSPAGRCQAYNEKDNLHIYDTNGPHALSQDGSHDIVYGQEVHRNEFGITKGTFWSPDGQSLCFYRMDQSMVPDYPLVDISTRIATVAPTKYPMAGEASHRVSMGVYHRASGKTIWLQTGNNLDQYYCGITWSPDSRKIFLYNLNRDQNHVKLLQFDANTGTLEKTLYEERHPKYVQPQHGLTFLPWDNDKFIYWSEKDGYDHLYLYSLKEERTLRCLTGNELGIVIDLLGFNTKTKSIIINCTGCSPLQHNLFSVNIEKGTHQLLGNATGVHSGQLSPDGKWVVDTWSSPQVPRQVDLINTHNGKVTTLLKAKDPWKGRQVPNITRGTLKAADGTTDLYYRLIQPTHFDPNKKYPAIIYVYGGPHTRLVDDSWHYMSRGWETYMAQLGYVVFVLDNRGSSERGLEFENVTFRQLGTEEMKDQMQGVAFLKSLPYVDASRLGVHGWSYGGFMTTNLMLTYADDFKVGVAGGPVIDWKYYEVMYGERYMDTPQDNPDGYKNNNLTLRAGDLKGRLLIIFGYNDPVCVPQHTLSFIRACENAGTHPDLLTYPGDGHNMMGRDRVHLYEHITRYFEDHLK